ncbi:MAG TPA: hypothetical protein ENN07_08045 [candidate division Zixibacteria bacterium]|nr:hypothetical protein [candidate division Zixibacteria bacterium]
MKKILFALIIIALPLSVIAQYQNYPDLGLKTIGVKVGPAIPDSQHKVGFALAVFSDLGKLHEIVGLEASLEYFRVTKEVQQIYTNSHSDIAVYPTLKIMPKVESVKFQPYIGGGLGVHYLTDTPDERLTNADKNTSTRLEVHLTVGSTFRITDDITGVGCFKINLSDISTYNPYFGVSFNM